MTRLLIRVSSELPEEIATKFPQLTPTVHPATTTLTGDLADQDELQGVLSLLNGLGATVMEFVRIPG